MADIVSLIAGFNPAGFYNENRALDLQNDAQNMQNSRERKIMSLQDQLASNVQDPWGQYRIYNPQGARQTYLADQEQLEIGSRFARNFKNIDPRNREKAYLQFLKYAPKIGVDVSDLPAYYDAAQIDPFMEQMASLGLSSREQAALEAEDKRIESQREWDIKKNDMALNNQMRLARYNAQLDAEKAKAFDAKGAMDLRKEFRSNNKDYYTVGDAFAKIKAVAQDPSPAGDMSLIFNYMKMQDPQSVVRESEFANAENARAWFDEQGVPTFVRLAYEKAKQGTRLTDKQRADFLNRARDLYIAQKGRFDEEGRYFSDISRKSGIDPRYVVSDPYNFGDALEISEPANTREDGYSVTPWSVLDTSDPRVKDALENGYSPEEIINFLQRGK